MASGALLQMLGDIGFSLEDATLCVADLGPGSFTGVKVAVTMAKTLAFALGVKVAGVTAFDLVSAVQSVAIPSRKGEYFLREPGREPEIVRALPTGSIGYGATFDNQQYPLAERCTAGVVSKATDPVDLIPLYIAEPSISKAKDTTVMGGPNA